MKVNIVFFLFLSFVSIKAQEMKPQETATIQLTITDVPSDNGMLYIGIYDSEQNFYNKRFKSAMSKIEKGKAVIELDQIPNGTYAISVFHDENNNRKLDTNFMGIPKEATGCSNNAKGFMSAPKWKDAKFDVVGQDIVMTIKI